MSNLKLGAVESRFADLIWTHVPVSSTQLVRLAESALGRKKSTTYTVLRRQCGRGKIQNEGGKVTALLSREEYYAAQSEQFVEETFSGSLPAFLAAFTARKRLSDEEISELQRLIDENRR